MFNVIYFLLLVENYLIDHVCPYTGFALIWPIFVPIKIIYEKKNIYIYEPQSTLKLGFGQIQEAPRQK